MEQSGEAFFGSSTAHEYPDPEDYAPNSAKYSWDGEDYGYVPPALPSRSWNGNDQGDWPVRNHRNVDDSLGEPYQPVRDVTVDSDYEISDIDIA